MINNCFQLLKDVVLIFISVTFVKNLMLFEESVDINVMSNVKTRFIFLLSLVCF